MSRSIEVQHLGDIDPTTVQVKPTEPQYWGDGNYWYVSGMDRLHREEYFYSHRATSAVIYHLRGNEAVVNGEPFDAVTYKGGLSEINATLPDIQQAVEAVNMKHQEEDPRFGYIRRFVAGPQVDKHDFYTNQPGISINLDNLGLWEPVTLPRLDKTT